MHIHNKCFFCVGYIYSYYTRALPRNIFYRAFIRQRRRTYADLGVSEGIFTSKSNNRGYNVYVCARACVYILIHIGILYYCLIIIIIIIAEPKLFDPVSMSLFLFFSFFFLFIFCYIVRRWRRVRAQDAHCLSRNKRWWWWWRWRWRRW